MERLFAAVAGGLMTGWGTMFVALGRGRALPGAILLSAIAWFVIDSAGSVAVGVPLNVLGNVAFLGAIAWAASPGRRSAATVADPAR